MTQLLAAGTGAWSLAVAAEAPASTSRSLPLVETWAGPHGGVPPFDRVEVADFPPAIAAAMAAYRAELDAITRQTDAPTFANTLVPLEQAGRVYRQVLAVYRVWSANRSTPEFQAIERELEPRLAAFEDEITQNEPLFRRLEAVYHSPDKAALTPEQQRLVWLQYTEFVRAGAKLDAAGKARVAEINQRLAGLFTRFSQNLLADEEALGVVLTNEVELAGLPESLRAAAAAEAERRGLPGQWVIANTRSSAEPFLTYSSRRDLREQVWRRFVSRGDHPGERDNKPLITEILALRAERAKRLGYPTHAHWRLENAMAQTPERALALMEAVWTPAVARVREEVADMQAIADADRAGVRIEPWDYRYYAEKVRLAKYDLDENAVKPYLQLDRLRDGMFWVAEQLFDLRFAPVTGVPVFHPDVRVWEVTTGGERPVGLFYFDPYARPGKRSGAWMTAYRSQERLAGPLTPLVSNNSNFMPGTPGRPVLVSWDDAKTLFHEFGHALHGLCSDVTYPSLSGTQVPRDYVELPSQILERWLSTPELLGRFALHHETGEPLPATLVKRLEQTATFNQGFATVEFLASALVDMRLHLAGDEPIDPAVFERRELERLGMPSEIVMRHRLPQFAHLFAGDGYSAGYYSYLWADTLTADAAEAFKEAGGLYDRTVAARFRSHVLSAGNTIDPAEAYRRFRGREAGIEALMRDRGFPVPEARTAALPKVRVTDDRRGFVDATGRAYVPFGVNYFRPGTGWAPQVWKQFDPEATRRDFARLRELGANCVRVFLTFGSFYTEPGRLSPEGLAKFDQFLDLAEAAGLYVHPTGPDHWEGLPEWARGDRIADERVLEALEAFWRQFAARYRGRSALFAYDLLNEPEVRWDSPVMRERWNVWLAEQYGSAAALAAAWGVPSVEWGQQPVPPRDSPPGRVLLDYQRFREAVADTWTRRQAAAIKAADPEALVTVGLIQWSVPIGLAGSWQYSGFRPTRQAPMLDFLEVHFYPLARGFYEYASEEDEQRNLAYLECVVREVAGAGKPTVIAEFGWYGGGQPSIDGGRHRAATEEQQARWCRRVVETTAGWACGWLNWGLYDHPGARDVTEWIGLLTADGREKAWARAFRDLAGTLVREPLRRPVEVLRPVLEWDSLLTDARARAAYRERYFEAYRASQP